MSGPGYLDGGMYCLRICRTDRVHHRQLSLEERAKKKASERLLVSWNRIVREDFNLERNCDNHTQYMEEAHCNEKLQNCQLKSFRTPDDRIFNASLQYTES